MSHSLIHLPPAHHSHPPSHVISCFIPGSKLTFSTNLFHHSLLAPCTHLDFLLGLYWTGLTLLNGFSFLVLFIFFYFGSCSRLSWLNCQLSSARKYSIFTYLLDIGNHIKCVFSCMGLDPNIALRHRPYTCSSNFIPYCSPCGNRKFPTPANQTYSAIPVLGVFPSCRLLP